MVIKKIRGGSIVEVVVATTVISICIGIASLLYVRVLKSTTSFELTRKQIQIQSNLLQKMYQGEHFSEVHDVETIVRSNDSVAHFHYYDFQNKLIWQQEWFLERK